MKYATISVRYKTMSYGAATRLQPVSEPAQLDEILDWDVAPIAKEFPSQAVRVKVIDAESPAMLPA
jgi:hypothetical protein